IEFLGRLDHQVKVRGFRIEPGEIEAVLRQHSAVDEALVIADEISGSKRLVAYIVFAKSMSSDEERTTATEDVEQVQEGADSALMSELRALVQEVLPPYMVPAIFMALDALPLTPNGKIDRRALPRPTSQPRALSRSYQEPRTPVEQTLAQIWSQVLGVPQVGIHDNFFTLGGDSILSIQVISRAHAAGLHLTPRQLFQQQTIAQLAPLVSALLPAAAAPASLWQAGPVPLTPIQRWFFAQPLQHPDHFNQALLLCMPAAVSSRGLQQAMQAVCAQHDVFTLRFEQGATGWQQRADPQRLGEPWLAEPLLVVDLSQLAPQEQSCCITELARGWQGSLHLQHGPLLRLIRFGCGPQQADRLLLLAHHLLVDGVSWRIVLDELHLGLNQQAQGQPLHLPTASTSFQHWARHLATTGLAVSRAHADFWLAQARQGVAPLPRDLPRGSNLRRDGQVCTLTLSALETEALLRQTPRAYGTRIDEVLLAALLCTLSRWSGSRRVRLALEGHGREEAALGGSDLDLSRTVGWCTALYPLVLQVPAEGREDLGALLRSVKEQVRQVPQRGVGYGLLRWVAEKPEVRGVLEQEQE